jgi:hypothetical protein
MAKITKRPTTRITALNILMSRVPDSTNFHIMIQNTTIRLRRKTNNIMLFHIYNIIPILTSKCKGETPHFNAKNTFGYDVGGLLLIFNTEKWVSMEIS